MRLTVVVPVYNEVESLPALHAEATAVLDCHGFDAEMLFVDDGSRDGSWGIIRELAESDPRVRGIRFRRNFGKAAALQAGFAEARGDVVVTMDADLQDDPAEIPRLLGKIENGLGVVSGWKKERHDPWHKVLPSRLFNWAVSRLTGVDLHDHNCGLKAYRREVFDEVRLYGELHRFVPVLAAARGWTVGEIVVNHRPREHGQSKYGVGRLLKGLLDLMTVKFLTGFGKRPQHMLGTAGMIFLSLGALGLSYLAATWLGQRIWPSPDVLPLSQRPAVIYSVASLLFGGQLLSIGLLGEMIVANRDDSADGYSLADRTPESTDLAVPRETSDSEAFRRAG